LATARSSGWFWPRSPRPHAIVLPADVAYSAFTRGTGATSVPFEHLRGIAVLHTNPLHLIVSKRSGIRSPADLRSRRVGLGLPGSGTAVIANLVMTAFGVDSGMVKIEMLSYAEAAVRVGNDSLDALFVVGSGPSDAVKIATSAGARLLSLQAPELDTLRRDYPFLKRVVMPAGMYPFHDQPIHTLGVDSILVCSSRLDEATVYELTKRLFDELPSLVDAHPALRFMDFAQASATPIRLHDGAALYYREQELAR
jgi:TRAP transporter TAXI family solute receptor